MESDPLPDPESSLHAEGQSEMIDICDYCRVVSHEVNSLLHSNGRQRLPIRLAVLCARTLSELVLVSHLLIKRYCILERSKT